MEEIRYQQYERIMFLKKIWELINKKREDLAERSLLALDQINVQEGIEEEKQVMLKIISEFDGLIDKSMHEKTSQICNDITLRINEVKTNLLKDLDQKLGVINYVWGFILQIEILIDDWRETIYD